MPGPSSIQVDFAAFPGAASQGIHSPDLQTPAAAMHGQLVSGPRLAELPRPQSRSVHGQELRAYPGGDRAGSRGDEHPAPSCSIKLSGSKSISHKSVLIRNLERGEPRHDKRSRVTTSTR